MITVRVSNNQVISGLSEEQVDVIKRGLTFENPKYKQVVKFSKYALTNVPKTLRYYEYCLLDDKGLFTITVPRGYSLPDDIKVDCVINETVSSTVSFPEFLFTLRNHQEAAFMEYFKNTFTFPVLNGSIKLPTGKGKTVLGIYTASKLKEKTLVVVHKEDLVDSWTKDIKEAFGGKADVGLIKAKKRVIGKHFTIATIQTLNRLSPSELNKLFETFGFVIQDEMHHSPSTSFSLTSKFKAKYKLGLTATPERADGLTQVMYLYYGNFCYEYKDSLVEEDEDILPVSVRVKNVSDFFNPVIKHTSRGYTVPSDLNEDKHFNPNYALGPNELRIMDISYDSRPKIPYALIDKAVVLKTDVMRSIIRDILFHYNKGHSCLVFFKSVEALERYSEELREYLPDKDIGLYYGSNKKNCESVRERASNQRKFITLATYSKATEGTNINQWEVCFLVSSLANGKDVEQAIGRVRRKPKTEDKLDTAIVYDYRYSGAYLLSRHFEIRKKRYKDLHFDIQGDAPISDKPKSLFSRGFNPTR